MYLQESRPQHVAPEQIHHPLSRLCDGPAGRVQCGQTEQCRLAELGEFVEHKFVFLSTKRITL